MESTLTTKLVDKLYEIGFEDANSKAMWKKYCEDAKNEKNVQLDYQLLWTVVEINELAKKRDYSSADIIVTEDKLFESKQNIEKIKKGLLLLKYGKTYLEKRLINKGLLKTNDKQKWEEYCVNLDPEKRYVVLENVVSTLSKIEDGKTCFAKVKKEVISDRNYISNIKDICDGLKHFKTGNDFAKFLREKRNILTNTEKKPHTPHVK